MKNAFYDPSNDRIVIAAGMFDLDDNILKFVLAHEIAHGKLGHANSRAAVSYATTGAMFVLNAFVPGTGYLILSILPSRTTIPKLRKPKQILLHITPVSVWA